MKTVKIPKGKPLPVKGMGKRTRAAAKRKQVLARDEYTCRMCGEPYPEYNLEADHIIPLAEGGPDNISNMQTLCCACHNKKTEAERGRQWNTNGK